MKIIYIFYLLNFILLKIINCLIVLPLYHQPKKQNISSTYEFINNYMPNDLYTIIKMGSPPQNVEMIISEEDIIFSMRKHKCLLKNYYFDKSKSKSFLNITKQGKGSSRFYGSSEVEDTFYFYYDYEDISSNKITKVDNMRFVFEDEIKLNYQDNLKYNCAHLSLNLFRNNIANNDYNFILELKKLEVIENNVWSIKYLNELDKTNNLEGYLIIGEYPHIYEKEKYNILNIRSSLNNMNEKGWNFLFKNITINNDTILTHYMTGIISFSNSYIIGTEEYKSKISYYFNQYTKKNICFEDSTVSHYFVYYCKCNEFTKNDIKAFPELNFYHAEFNFTFRFRGDDLFLEKNGFYYFLIIFDRYDYKTWTLGKLFLNKYQLVFDHISKKINLYINKSEKEEINGKKDLYINNTTLLIIILVSIAGLSFIIGIIIGKIKFSFKKRNRRANELDNENEDYFIKKKDSITDSDDVTNISEEKAIN